MALDSSTVRLLSQLAEGDGKPLHECSPDEARSKDVGYQIHSNPIGFQYIRAACPDKNVKITYQLQACNEPVRSANPFCELAVPGMRALLLVLVLSRYSFRPLVDLLAAQLPQCHGPSSGSIMHNPSVRHL